MSSVFRDIFGLCRIVSLGKTSAALDAIHKHTVENLFVIAMIIGTLIGASQSILDLLSGDGFITVAKVFTFPAALISVSVLWSWLFCFLVQNKKDRFDIYAIFFGSSAFLLPGAIPILGTQILPFLLLGWPFIISRYTAKELELPPGQTFTYLILPPVVLLVCIRIVLFAVGKFMSMSSTLSEAGISA